MLDKITKLKQLALRTHYSCPDGWYSCPLSEDGCLDERENECNCGADKHNEKVELLFNEIIDGMEK